MLETYFKSLRDQAFQKIDDFRPGTWIYVKGATLEDLQVVARVLDIDLAEIRDSLDRFELPRLEHVDGTILCFVRHPSDREAGLYTDTLTLLFSPTFVVTISPDRSEIVEQVLTSKNPLTTTQRTKLLLHLFLKITQEYTNGIKRLRHTVAGFDARGASVDPNAILVLTKNEEVLNQYLMALVPIRNLLETLSVGRLIAFYEEDLDLLEDLMIAIRQSEDVCRVNIKSIRSLRDSYHIIFTNDVNRTIKLLTALTILFSIPTIVASIYGMNIALPIQQNHYAFWIILTFTLLASLLALFWFRGKRWL